MLLLFCHIPPNKMYINIININKFITGLKSFLKIINTLKKSTFEFYDLEHKK